MNGVWEYRFIILTSLVRDGGGGGGGGGGASHDSSSAFNKPLFQGEDSRPWPEEKRIRTLKKRIMDDLLSFKVKVFFFFLY